MTDKIKRDARARAAATGEPYTRAKRAVAHSPATAADVPGAKEVPQPVAVMLARHVRAAAKHLGTWRSLAEGARALPRDSGPSWEEPSGPAAPIVKADRAAFRALADLERWSERTALAAGAVTAMPDPWADDRVAAEAAMRALYPQPEGNSGGWCSETGGHLPQPGEKHVGSDPQPRVRHLLPGPVPEWSLCLFAEGRDVRRARDVVPGTPAAPIFDAAATLNTYACGWMDRHGDSPADLAAALDGLDELATQLASVTSQILGEVTRRIETGTLDGADAARLAAARERATAVLEEPSHQGWITNHLRGVFGEARDALTGATAKLPGGPLGIRIPGRLTRQVAGKTAAQVRDELGNEVFLQRQVGKTRPTDYSRADMLERILTWMHATGAASYDPAAHAATDPAAEGART